MKTHNELEKQVEAAYDYRGHVTITFKDGKTLEGFVFNRQFENPKLPQDNFIEVIVKGKDERLRLPIDSLASIALTGKDFAETFEEGKQRVQAGHTATDEEKGLL